MSEEVGQNKLLQYLDEVRAVAAALELDAEKVQCDGRQELRFSGGRPVGPGHLDIAYTVDLPDWAEDAAVNFLRLAKLGKSQISLPSPTP